MDNKPLAVVIEDDEDLAVVFAEAVRAAGYQAEYYHDGEQAVARLAQVTPYLVVLDLHLPGMTGLQILGQMRADERLKAARVIVASADDRLAESCRDKMTMVLLKPISLVQLRDLSQRLLPR